MAIKIYKDGSGVTFFDTVTEHSFSLAQDESVVASVNSDDSNALDIRIGATIESDSDIKLFFKTDYADFQDESGTALAASASATRDVINDIFNAHVSRGVFRGILLGEAGDDSIGVGSGTIKFQVGDTFVNFTDSKGYYIVDTAFDFTKQSNRTQAVLHYNTHSSKVTKVAVSGDSKLVDLDPTSSSDEFTETMSTFQLTTTNSTTFIPGSSGMIVAGNITSTGNLTSTGTPTLSGIQYPTSDGTSGQVIKTDGSGNLSFTDLPEEAAQSVVYARMSMSSAVLRGGAIQQNYTGVTDVVVKFDVEDDNDGGGITTNTTTNRMTVSSAGLYRLTANMSFHSTSARATPAVRFNVNGSSIDGESMGYIRAASGNNEASANISRVIYLSANDYIEVCCHDESNANGAIYAEEAIFEVEKIGGVQGATGPAGADGADGSDANLEGQKLEIELKASAYSQGWEGTIVKYGTDTVQAGKAYVYTSSGWTAVDADNENKTKGLFGMALGSDADVDGLLIRGIWTSTLFSGYSAGDTLYISLTEGAITNSIASHTTGDFVRVVGYALGSNAIFLDPSPDYIEIG